ncbi:MAG: pyridoxal phosphate-dependent aminotransferase [Deltaproteobacteria bacterium]|nr:pyridoxal phosphate-dependent aminotransferase [Deltaproteobacteria bacterium]
MTIADKISSSIENSSWIRKMFEEGNRRKKVYGAENVYDFSIGNPNLEPPKRFKEVLSDLINDPTPGLHGYMSNAGFDSTRQAVAEYLNKTNLKQFTKEEIVMTAGAGGGCNVVFKTILNPKDEVIIPSPFFFEYSSWLDNHQGVPVIVPTKPDFQLDCEAISNAITERTRAVLINSPNNPSGKIYTEGEITELVGVLTSHSKKKGMSIYLISDEPYRKIVYDGNSVPSILDSYNESFVISSFSKDLSLAGERIGYIAANPDIIDRDIVMQGIVLSNRVLGYTNASALMQRAVALLMEESVDISFYKKNRDLLCDGLSSFGYDLRKPEGAFYLFPKTPIEDDVSFVKALQEENILTVPGQGFSCPGHFRISYCVSPTTIEGSLPGFERVMKKYRR